jgi:hypothetical protein
MPFFKFIDFINYYGKYNIKLNKLRNYNKNRYLLHDISFKQISRNIYYNFYTLQNKNKEDYLFKDKVIKNFSSIFFHYKKNKYNLKNINFNQNLYSLNINENNFFNILKKKKKNLKKLYINQIVNNLQLNNFDNN